MIKGKVFNRIVVKVDVEKANNLNGLLIDRNWGHDGKHMTHDGIVVENNTDIEVKIGSKIWFDYRMQWYAGSRYNGSEWDGSDEHGVYYYLLKKQEYVDIVKTQDGEAFGSNIGFLRPPKETKTASGIIIPQTVEKVDDRGIVVLPNGGINEGDEIIYAVDNDYPSDSIESDWIKKDGKNIIFTGLDYVFAVIKGNDIEPYGNWTIMKPLDENDEWVKSDSGIYLPEKEKVLNGLGVVHRSIKYKEGDKLYYTKRGYNSFMFNEEKYYAVRNDNVIWEYLD